VAQLCQHQDDFEALNAEVLIVSFGALPAAQAWLEETCAPFRLLLDPERQVYEAYGLERSLLRSWNLKTLWRYVQLLASCSPPVAGGAASRATRRSWAAISLWTQLASFGWRIGATTPQIVPRWGVYSPFCANCRMPDVSNEPRITVYVLGRSS
jgi:hypothetical protein